MPIAYYLRSPSIGMSTTKAGCLQFGSPPQERRAQNTYSPAILWMYVSAIAGIDFSFAEPSRRLMILLIQWIHLIHVRGSLLSFAIKPDLPHPRGLSVSFAKPGSDWLVLVSKFHLIHTKISSLPSRTSYPSSIFFPISIVPNISHGFELLTCFCQGQGFCLLCSSLYNGA